MSCPGLAGGPGPQASASAPTLSRPRVATLPPPPSPGPALGALGIGPAPMVAAPAAGMPGPAGAPELHKRVVDLEKSLQFVQQQHADTLLSLHAEVERLRRDNRDLHYKLIMNQKLQRKGMTSSSSHSLKSHSCIALPAFEGQNVHRGKGGGSYELLSFGSRERDSADEGLTCITHDEEEPEASNSTLTPMMPCQPQFKHILGLAASLKLPSHMRKLSTLQQCELVIQQLWNANHLQAQELQHLKSILEDSARQGNNGLPASHAKHQEGMQFPKVADKNAAKKCLILAPLAGAERAVLPALKQTLRNSFAERQKKMQAIQSRRFHRTVL